MTFPQRLDLVLTEMQKAEAEAARLSQEIARLHEVHLMLEGQKLLLEALIAEETPSCPSTSSSQPSSQALSD